MGSFAKHKIVIFLFLVGLLCLEVVLISIVMFILIILIVNPLLILIFIVGWLLLDFLPICKLRTGIKVFNFRFIWLMLNMFVIHLINFLLDQSLFSEAYLIIFHWIQFVINVMIILREDIIIVSSSHLSITVTNLHDWIVHVLTAK